MPSSGRSRSSAIRVDVLRDSIKLHVGGRNGHSASHRTRGEGGEQGDPLMPLLYALGQHQALVAAKNRLAESEKVFAFHDDVFMVTSPARVGVAYTVMQ